MATVAQATSTTLSGQNHIDALLGNLPNWNYVTPGTNTLYYSFSVASNLESGNPSLLSAPLAFSASQVAATRGAMAYVAKLTGINFVETADANLAQVHFANANLAGSGTTGLDSNRIGYSYNSSNVVTKFTAASYVYLDNAEWAGMNANLTPGTQGYETLLHELGHMLGLKHPFEGTIKLPSTTNNTSHTLMSYTHSGGIHSTFSENDIAALKWLYGGDGLAGNLGVNSTTGARWLAGTGTANSLAGGSANDILEGAGGNDVLNGGAGTDTAFYNGARSGYTVVRTGTGTWNVSGAEGSDTLTNIELLRFTDATVTLSSGAVTMTAPSATAGVLALPGGEAMLTSVARAEEPVWRAADDIDVQLIGRHGHGHGHFDLA
ncbi:reprolysin-like metallopeptidase [Pseudoduganella lutea]|uniref:Matrixin n=1 Tax=Pseudoduganella lutea TaxID=321985 RepID=A0A4P6L3U2_9BURK|nr:matrixin [Pseudoduganella lutea]QBE65492.1 matrixin [Pseudoduganella lutea]